MTHKTNIWDRNRSRMPSRDDILKQLFYNCPLENVLLDTHVRAVYLNKLFREKPAGTFPQKKKITKKKLETNKTASLEVCSIQTLPGGLQSVIRAISASTIIIILPFVASVLLITVRLSS